MPKKRKSKFVRLRFRKGDTAHNLLTAVQHWVHEHGGTVIVGGGIEVQQWPGMGTANYRVAVRCMGKLPRGKDEKAEAA